MRISKFIKKLSVELHCLKLPTILLLINIYNVERLVLFNSLIAHCFVVWFRKSNVFFATKKNCMQNQCNFLTSFVSDVLKRFSCSIFSEEKCSTCNQDTISQTLGSVYLHTKQRFLCTRRQLIYESLLFGRNSSLARERGRKHEVISFLLYYLRSVFLI